MLKEDKVRFIRSRFEQLESDRKQWNNLFEDIRAYIYPTTASFINRQPGDKALDRNRKIFDPTAERAHSDLVGALMGGMMNSALKWFSYGVVDQTINEMPDVRKHLELATDQVLNIFSNPNSNFYPSSHEMVYELTGLGSGFMLKRGRGSSSHFEAVPLADIFFEENDFGQVDSIYRPIMMTPKQIMDQFPKVEKQDPEIWEQLETSYLNDATNLNKWRVIHCVKPRMKRNKSKNNAMNKKFMSVYLLDRGEGTLLEESGYDRFPYYGARWEKIAGRESLGRGVGHRAIKDAKVLNKMVQTNLEAGEQIVKPALQAPLNAYVGGINLTPRAVNKYKPVIGINDPTLKPINSIGNLPIGLEMEQQRRNAIKESFFIDLLQEDKQARMTQLEAAQNQQERLVKMAPQLLRLQTEFMNRLVQDLYEEIEEEEMLKQFPRPEELEDMAIIYNSPLVLAQKQAEIGNITGFANALAQYGQIFPDLLLVPKAGEIGRIISNVFNVPARALNSQEEIDAEKDRQRKIAENQAAAEQTELLTRAGRNVADVGAAVF